MRNAKKKQRTQDCARYYRFKCYSLMSLTCTAV